MHTVLLLWCRPPFKKVCIIGRPYHLKRESKGVSLDVLQPLFQHLTDPASGQCGIGVCHLDAGGGVALQHSGQHRGAAAPKVDGLRFSLPFLRFTFLLKISPDVHFLLCFLVKPNSLRKFAS